MSDKNPADLSFTGCKSLSIGMVLFPGFTLLDLSRSADGIRTECGRPISSGKRWSPFRRTWGSR